VEITASTPRAQRAGTPRAGSQLFPLAQLQAHWPESAHTAAGRSGYLSLNLLSIKDFNESVEVANGLPLFMTLWFIPAEQDTWRRFRLPARNAGTTGRRWLDGPPTERPLPCVVATAVSGRRR
jgi:hypothetical protein